MREFPDRTFSEVCYLGQPSVSFRDDPHDGTRSDNETGPVLI